MVHLHFWWSDANVRPYWCERLGQWTHHYATRATHPRHRGCCTGSWPPHRSGHFPHNKTIHNFRKNAGITPKKESLNELECLSYLTKNPNTKLEPTAELFNVPRTTLRRRREGVNQRVYQHPPNKKLKEAEKHAILDMIKRLDNTNLSVSKSWRTAAANSIIEEQSSPTNSNVNFVGPRWVDKFIQRHQLQVQRGKIRDLVRQEAICHPAIFCNSDRLVGWKWAILIPR